MTADQPAGQDISCAVSTGDGGAAVEVWAIPGASRTEITGLHGGAVRIRVAAPAEGGKANRALADLLTTITGADVEMTRGHRSRRKRFLVRGVGPAELARLISDQIG